MSYYRASDCSTKPTSTYALQVVHVGFSIGVRAQPCLHRPWPVPRAVIVYLIFDIWLATPMGATNSDGCNLFFFVSPLSCESFMAFMEDTRMAANRSIAQWANHLIARWVNLGKSWTSYCALRYMMSSWQPRCLYNILRCTGAPVSRGGPTL